MNRRVLLSCAIAALCAACAHVPLATGPADEPGAPEPRIAGAPALAGSAAVFEQRLRDRALADAKHGRWAEAAASWEILGALRPGAAEYRDRLAEARRAIHSAVPERFGRAQQAHRRGDLEGATTQYLGVLALQPDHEPAADALRAIERDRNRALYLGKFSRITLMRSPASSAPAAKPAIAPDRNDVEHAALLARQGELDAAIALLERHVASPARDAKACEALAALQLQKAGATAARLKQPPRAAAPPRASSPCP